MHALKRHLKADLLALRKAFLAGHIRCGQVCVDEPPFGWRGGGSQWTKLERGGPTPGGGMPGGGMPGRGGPPGIPGGPPGKPGRGGNIPGGPAYSLSKINNMAHGLS